MHRTDNNLLKNLLKRNRYVLGDTSCSPEMLNQAYKLPFISMPMSEMEKVKEEMRPLSVQQSYPSNSYKYEPVFDECVLHYEHLVEMRTDVDVGMEYTECWGAIFNIDNPFLKKLPDYPPVESIHKMFEETKVILETVKFIYHVVRYEKTDRFIFIWSGWVGAEEGGQTMRTLPTMSSEAYWRSKDIDKRLYGAHWQRTEKDLDNGLQSHVANTLGFLHYVFLYAKYGEKHAVEKVPSKAKPRRITPLNVKKPWNTATGPHILFLDKLPTKQKEECENTGSTKKPHRRRGHWRTLNHPKYRHHPQFGKKIYVKPSFIGPNESEYEGNTYRLIKPLDEVFSDDD